MGVYINPRDMSKEQFLEEHGTLLDERPKKHRDEDNIVVCLVDNGGFTAAAVCHNADELTAFQDTRDSRLKFWYMVPFDALVPVFNESIVDELRNNA